MDTDEYNGPIKLDHNSKKDREHGKIEKRKGENAMVRKSYTLEYKAKMVIQVLRGEIDITYIKMQYGHMYLTAVIDWYSRLIVG